MNARAKTNLSSSGTGRWQPQTWIRFTWIPRSWTVSQQRIDPLGSLSAWPLAPAIAIALCAYAIYATFMHRDQITHPVAAVVAFALCSAAGAMHVRAALPHRARYGGEAYRVVIALAGASMVVEVISTWGQNSFLQDDYGQIALGVFLAAGAPYRPAVQIGALAGVASLVAGALAVIQDPYFVVPNVPLLERAVVAVVPVMGLGLAGAAYANQIVSAVMAWQRSLSLVTVDQEHESFDGLARTVQQEQLAAISDEALPFLAEVASKGVLNEQDIDHARRLARAVRASLVAELNHSWLEQLRIQLPSQNPVGENFTQPYLTIRDENRRAFRMHGELRTALAALLSELCTNGRLAASVVAIHLEPDAADPTRRTRARLEAQFERVELRSLSMLRPYLHILQLVSGNARYAARQGKLHVLFSYDHEPSGRQQGGRASIE